MTWPSPILGEARALLRLAVPTRPIALVNMGMSVTDTLMVSAAFGPRRLAALASDRLRKARFGVAPETRLPAGAYLPAVSGQVCAGLAARAGAAAAGGACVIADAVFPAPAEREAIAAAAARAGAPFLGVWLDLAPEALRARVAARRGGPSDATVAVLDGQLDYDLGPIDWLRLDAGPEPDRIAAAILRNLQQPGA